MFTALKPFHDIRSDYLVMDKIKNGLRPERPINATVLGLSDGMWYSMTKAWSVDPHQRPMLGELDIVILGHVVGCSQHTYAGFV